MSWGETLDSQKSALRWDIKRTMKSLCTKLAEIGEECFVVTVNMSNGWVGHMGSVHGADYLNEKMFIAYDFLEYCRESDGSESVDDEEATDSASETESAAGSDDEGVEPNREGEGHDEDTPICIQRASSEVDEHAQRKRLKQCQQRLKQRSLLSSRLQRQQLHRQPGQSYVRHSYIRQPGQSYARHSYIRQSPYPLRERKKVTRFVAQQECEKRNGKGQELDGNRLNCPLCNMSFRHLKLYDQHVSENHGKGDAGRTYSCHRCAYECQGRTALFRHGIRCARSYRNVKMKLENEEMMQ